MTRGMTLVEVVVATAIMLVIFLGFFEAYKLAAQETSGSEVRTAAASIMADQMEYIRSLSYSVVGTVGGTPAGGIPQTQTRTLNGMSYTIRTVIAYVDDAADGTGASDTNSLTHDYKSIKVEVQWNVNGAIQSISENTLIAPIGLETSLATFICAG